MNSVARFDVGGMQWRLQALAACLDGTLRPMPEAAAAAAVLEVIDHELLCIECGYDLRGLAPSMLCPECGQPVTRSLRSDHLAGADPQWLKTVAKGQFWMTLGVNFAVWSVATFLLIAVLSAFIPKLGGGWFAAVLTILMLLAAGGFVCAIIGVLMLTIRDPRAALVETALSPRRLTRDGMQGLAFAIVAAFALPRLLGMPTPPVVGAIEAMVFTIIATILFVAWMRYLATLMLRAPQAKLAVRADRIAKRLAWIIPLNMALYLLFSFQVGGVTGRGAIALLWSLLMIWLLAALLGLASLCRAIRGEMKRCLTEAIASVPAKSDH